MKMIDNQLYLSISEFAELSGVLRKTLIYYDRVHLLSPARTETNGYRSYSLDQLGTLNIITALKESGCSLADISLLEEQGKLEDPDILKEGQNALTRKINALNALDSLLASRVGQSLEYKNKVKTMMLEDDMPIYVSSITKDISELDDTDRLTLIRECMEHDIPVGFDEGLLMSKKSLDGKTSEATMVVYTPLQANRAIPAGRYISALGDAEHIEKLYGQMVKAVAKSKWKSKGSVYVRYLREGDTPYIQYFTRIVKRQS